MEAGMPEIAVVTNTEKIDKKDAQKLRQSLAAAGMKDPLWIETRKGSESKAAAAKALKQGAETVVVCGGDGSVRAASEEASTQPCAMTSRSTSWPAAVSTWPC